MQKMLKHGAALLRRVIWLGMGLQVLLGVLWVLYNIGVEHAYGMDWNSAEAFAEANRQWGILYPLILKMIVGMAQWLPIPYYCITYFLQLVFALVAGECLLKALTDWSKSRQICGTVILATIPMALQGHLAVLPYSVAGSLVLLELAACIRLCQKENWRIVELLPMYVFWILSALCMSEYLWIGALPALWVSVKYLLKKKISGKEALGIGVAALGISIIVCVVGALWQAGKQEDSLGWKHTLTARCVWSSLLYDISAQWPEELVVLIGSEKLQQAAIYPEVMQEDFFAGLQQLDREQEDAYLELMMASAWKTNGKQLALELAYDGVGYLFPGIVVMKQLSGQGFLSLTGLNYWYWIEQQSTWGGIYMRYYCRWFWVAAVLAMVIRLAHGISGRKKETGLRSGATFTGLIMGLGMAVLAAVYYTIVGIGAYDYKLTAWWLVIWCAGTLLLTGEREEE